MNGSYKLFIRTKKKTGINTHCVTFPLTQKGQHEAEEMLEKMKKEPAVHEAWLSRFDENGLQKLKEYKRETET